MSHEEERVNIAHNGHKKVKELFCYDTKLKEIFAISELL